MPDTDAAVEWLLSWSSDPPWILGEKDPNSLSSSFTATVFTSVDHLRRHISARNGRLNLYFLPSNAKSTIKTTPTKGEMTEVVSLSLDFDLPKQGPPTATAPTEENFKIILNRIYSIEPPPTAIIFSGGGYQVFWKFPTPLPAAEHLERVEALGKELVKSLGADHTHNINRWMRLPGTVNLPDERKRKRGRIPAEAYVVEAYWDRRWDYLTDQTPSLPDDYHIFATDDPLASAATPTNKGSVTRVDDLPVRWQKLVRSGDTTDYNGDRSSLVFAFCCYAARRAWADEDIIAVLTSRNYGISSHVLEQRNHDGYATRQVERARKLIAEDWDYTAQNKYDPSSPANIRRALTEMGIKLSHDTFADRYYVNGTTIPIRELDDVAESEIRIQVYDRYRFYINHNVQRDVMATTARLNSFNPVINYLNSLTWDGTKRLRKWLIKYAGAMDSPYTRAVSKLVLTAAVRRARQPGFKFDHMLVLISPEQGTGKSSAIAALCPNFAWFTDSMPLKLSDQKAIEHLLGKWIVECSELQGIHASDVETVKAFISRSEDRARPAYGHHPVSHPRACIFIGTTNSEVFLRDIENRRFLPVRVRTIDVASLTADRDQLWAEAVLAERELSQSFDALALPAEYRQEAAIHQNDARIDDPWVDILCEHLAPFDRGKIVSSEVWRLLGVPAERQGPLVNKRLTDAMLQIGWKRSYAIFRDQGPSDNKDLGLNDKGRGLRCFIKGIDTGERNNYPTLKVEKDYNDPFGPPQVSYEDKSKPDPTSRTSTQAYNPDEVFPHVDDDIPF